MQNSVDETIETRVVVMLAGLILYEQVVSVLQLAVKECKKSTACPLSREAKEVSILGWPCRIRQLSPFRSTFCRRHVEWTEIFGRSIIGCCWFVIYKMALLPREKRVDISSSTIK